MEHEGEEADILEDLGPADVRVLLQAEEELSQVVFVVPMFRGNKVNVKIFVSKMYIIDTFQGFNALQCFVKESVSSASNGRECFPPQKPPLTIFSCQRLGELNAPLSL